MAYHSLKRVLSETSVEQKCRLLFGASLLLVIGSGFIVVDSIAENLVSRTLEQERVNIRQRGAAFAEMSMLKVHFLAWLEQEDKKNDEESQARRLLVEEFLQGLEDHSYTVELLGLSDNPKLGIRRPAVPWEEEIIEQLIEDSKQEMLRLASRDPRSDDGQGEGREPQVPQGFDSFSPTFPSEDRPRENGTSDTNARGPTTRPDGDGGFAADRGGRVDFWSAEARRAGEGELAGREPVPGRIFRDKLIPDRDEYHYFQPVFWEKRCISCHPSIASSTSLAAGGDEFGIHHYEPLRVLKVVLPYQESREATHYIRAVLSATGILSSFSAWGPSI
jgi:hypothetical protein